MMEKIKNKCINIKYKIVFITLAVSLFTIVVLLLTNTLISKNIYKFYKIKKAVNMIEVIDDYYNGENIINLSKEIDKLTEIGNIGMAITDNNSNVIFYSDNSSFKSINDFVNNKTGKIKYKKDNIVAFDKDDGNKFTIIEGTLKNGYKVYFKINYYEINDYLKVTNIILTCIGIIVLIIVNIFAVTISRNIRKPYDELNRITKKMSNLDFSERYRKNDTNDEINILGSNINVLSDKLEDTIHDLKSNNTMLEKDIEEKSQVENMRNQFISDVSHELKTPIGLIQGYSEGLIENVNDDPESRKFYAEVIRDESIKMDAMVKKLLELMKLENSNNQLKDEEFNLRDLIDEEIKRETVNISDRKIELEVDTPKKIMVYADPEYIEQIINNYLNNAIKHCEEKNGEKKIIIRTEKQKNHKLRLFIYNSGKNIDEEYKNKIWDRFYRIDSARDRQEGGTGIGLSLVKAIMNNYKNKFGFENYDNGIEFYADINLPTK